MPTNNFHLAIGSGDLFVNSRVQLDGVGDVIQHLLEGVHRLLVKEQPHDLARLYTVQDKGLADLRLVSG